jgi:hypothetical protein
LQHTQRKLHRLWVEIFYRVKIRGVLFWNALFAAKIKKHAPPVGPDLLQQGDCMKHITGGDLQILTSRLKYSRVWACLWLMPPSEIKVAIMAVLNYYKYKFSLFFESWLVLTKKRPHL